MKFRFKVYYYKPDENFLAPVPDNFKWINAKSKESAKEIFNARFPNLRIIDVE